MSLPKVNQRKPLDAPFSATGSAPCKINLTLDVFAPRPDGFHSLSSLVVPMAYPADTITVSADFLDDPAAPTQITLTCDNSALPTGDGNLAYRAARDFARVFLPEAGMKISVDLQKRLPYQAGLGGGSSDAATVLRLLQRNYLKDKALNNPMAELNVRGSVKQIAAGIGSDVPLFLVSGPVWMQGRGEQVNPLHDALPPLFGVIVKPAVGVLTGPAYALLDALPNRPTNPNKIYTGFTSSFFAALHTNKISGADDLGPLLHNDFERAILPAYPEVNAAHQAVQEAGAVRALLCGSGSAVFGLAQDRNHARALADTLRGKFPYVAETGTLAP